MNEIIIDENKNQLIKIFSDVIEEFLKERYSNQNTLLSYRRYLTKYMNTLNINSLADFGRIPYPELRTKTMDFINLYSSSNTKRVVAACLRAFWGYLCDSYNYPKNPVASKMNLPARQSKSKTKSLDWDTLNQTLQRLKAFSVDGYMEHLTYTLVTLLSTTSLRISEALQVTIEMVNNGKLVVTQKQSRQREIELPRETQRVLSEFCSKYNILAGPFFLLQNGDHLSRNYAHYLIKKATGISPHGFRKSVIEMLIASGEHQHEVAKVSGHSSINMVYYYDNKDNTPKAHMKLAKRLNL